MAPVLMPSLLSGLTGNTVGLELPGIPTPSASSEASGGVGGLARVPLKSGAPGPSREADLNLLMPASMEEVLKYEPSSRGASQHDSPMPDVKPEDIAEIVIDDSDDLDQTIEEPQAATSPVREPTPCKKRGLDDLISSSSPSKKCGTQDKDTSAPSSEDDLPKGVKLEDILPKRYDTLCSDHGWVHKVRCSLLGLEAGTIPSREDIDSSVRFTPRAASKETESPEIIAEHWLPVLREEGLLMECPRDQFTSKPGWVPLYTLDSLTKYLPAALSAFSGSGAPSLPAVVPPQHPGSTDREFLLTNFHRHGCLVRQSLTVGGRWRQLAFCPYCGIINENADTAFSHVRKHLDLLFVYRGCHAKSYVNGQALQRHMTYQCISAMAILENLSEVGLPVSTMKPHEAP